MTLSYRVLRAAVIDYVRMFIGLGLLCLCRLDYYSPE